jgi:hypothetical protein
MINKSSSDFMYNWIREKSGKKTNMETKQMSMWTCQFCGQDTSNVEYDYLNGYDHLSCALEADNKARANEFEHCILCGVETSVKIGTHIDMRHGYIEGAGQLCPSCANKDETPLLGLGTTNPGHRLILVDETTILYTPNDQELGAKVRKLYWENKNK